MGLSFAAQAHTPVRWYFNPRAPCGARRRLDGDRRARRDFNPRAPCGARHRPARMHPALFYFNQRAPCGARRQTALKFPTETAISIHAPLAGRDDPLYFFRRAIKIFQSTRPLRGATADVDTTAWKYGVFQSTRPLRGATTAPRPLTTRIPYFNPRAPCGARLFLPQIWITILIFQSTRPLRGATANIYLLIISGHISIHAPLAGRDYGRGCNFLFCNYFNPRAPCGARQQI